MLRTTNDARSSHAIRARSSDVNRSTLHFKGAAAAAPGNLIGRAGDRMVIAPTSVGGPQQLKHGRATPRLDTVRYLTTVPAWSDLQRLGLDAVAPALNSPAS